MSDSLQPHGLWPTRLLCPWDSPGKSTGVGCHFLLQEIFPTQGSNPLFLHWQADSYSWATWEAHQRRQEKRKNIYCFVERTLKNFKDCGWTPDPPDRFFSSFFPIFKAWREKRLTLQQTTGLKIPTRFRKRWYLTHEPPNTQSVPVLNGTNQRTGDRLKQGFPKKNIFL